MAVVEELKAMRIGCDQAVVAILPAGGDTAASLKYQGQDSEGKKMTAGIYNLPGVQTININPNVSMETAFYDDGPGEVASTLGNIEVSFTKSSLSPKEKALLLGKRIYTAGTKTGVLSSANDIPPWVAFGFRTLKSDGTYRYVWLLKGKFVEPADNNETKADSINFQSEEITGRFVRVNREFPVKNNVTGTEADTKIKPWKTELDAASVAVAGADPTTTKLIEKWFDAPILPGITPAE